MSFQNFQNFVSWHISVSEVSSFVGHVLALFWLVECACFETI